MQLFKAAGRRAPATTINNQQINFTTACHKPGCIIRRYTLNSAILAQIVKEGGQPEIFIFCGYHGYWGDPDTAADSCCDLHQSCRKWGLYLIAGDDPADFAWPVKGCEVLCRLSESTEEKEVQLATILLKEGACIVRSILYPVVNKSGTMRVFRPQGVTDAAA